MPSVLAVIRCSRLPSSSNAFSPFNSRAHIPCFQALDHPIPPSPLRSSALITAPASFGAEFAWIWLPGNIPYKCERCRCFGSCSSKSNNHSCSCPYLPIWYGCNRSEEHTSELQSLMRNSYAVFCLKKKKHHK